MAKMKIKFKTGMGANFSGGLRVDAKINGELVGSTSDKVAAGIASAFGKKNAVPFILGTDSPIGGTFDYPMTGQATFVLERSNGKQISNEVSFTASDAQKVIVKIVKKGMLAKIFTGKFYAVKIKVKK